jgi:hypothetical protein
MKKGINRRERIKRESGMKTESSCMNFVSAFLILTISVLPC